MEILISKVLSLKIIEDSILFILISMIISAQMSLFSSMIYVNLMIFEVIGDHPNLFFADLLTINY
jgi:hypothetical protein